VDDLLIGAEEQKVGKAGKVWERRSRAPPFILPNCKFIICMFDYFEETRTSSFPRGNAGSGQLSLAPGRTD